MPTQYETWKHEGNGRLFIRRAGGTEMMQVRGQREFQLTTDEREAHEARCAKPEQNPFRNGTLTPVKLIETEEDLAALDDDDAGEKAKGKAPAPVKPEDADPNTMSVSEMDELIDGHWKTMDARLEKITAVMTVSRMLDRATEREAATGRLERIRKRLEELSPDRGKVRGKDAIGEGTGEDPARGTGVSELTPPEGAEAARGQG